MMRLGELLSGTPAARRWAGESVAAEIVKIPTLRPGGRQAAICPACSNAEAATGTSNASARRGRIRAKNPQVVAMPEQPSATKSRPTAMNACTKGSISSQTMASGVAPGTTA